MEGSEAILSYRGSLRPTPADKRHWHTKVPSQSAALKAGCPTRYFPTAVPHWIPGAKVASYWAGIEEMESIQIPGTDPITGGQVCYGRRQGC